MNSSVEIGIFLSLFVSNLPNFLICVVAVIVVLVRRKQLSVAGTWALLGFGLSLALCLIVPISQTVVQSWLIHGNSSAASSGVLYGGLGFF